MKSFINKVKFRWKFAPIWVKVLDLVCWLVLVCLIVWGIM